MLYLTIVLFAVSAAIGLSILVKWFAEQEAPKAVVYTHGGLAAAALLLLAFYAFQHPDHYPMISLILFVAAALGGFALFFMDRLKDKRPVAVALVHGLIAVAAFVMLLVFAIA
ncbi:MAG: hypothetical protein FH748_03095 [Balneolaceae bacterium]|nr:hypothetical protein [Balneolaceae bacterium]